MPTFEEKIVAVERRDTEIKEVVVNKDRIVEKDKLIIKENTRNYIETKLQVVDRYEEKIVPVNTSVEKIIEIPYVLEKIVEKIVIMPQVVEVIKYIHEIAAEAELGVAVGVDVSVEEIRYKELYGKLRVHFEGVLAELRKLRTSNPALKVQIEIIETFLIELDGLIKFPRFIEVEKEKKVEVEVTRPVLVPTKDSASIRNEVALSLLVDKLIGEIRGIKKSNPSLKLNLDEDLQLIFFSEAFGNGKLSEDLNAQLRSYKESQYNKLLALGTSWTNDHDLIINTVLEERFTLANTVRNANLEIEKSKAIADQRLEGYRGLRQTFALLSSKLENLEREFGVVSKNFEANPAVTNELRRLFTSIDDLRKTLTVDPRSLRAEEPVFVLGDIYGSEEGYVRLQSAFRALDQENQLLRDRYVKWQKEVPNASILADKEKIIESLTRQITNMTVEVSNLRSQPVTNVNVSSNTQEFEIKIRTLNSRIQELESQLRTQKVDYEGQLRSKNQLIRELEDKLATAAKGDDSRITGTNYGSSSNVDKLTSSVHSNSSGTGGSQIASSYISGSNVSSSSNPTGPRTYGTSNYGNTTTANTAGTTAQSGYSSSYKPSTYGTSPATGTGIVGATTGTSAVLSGSGIGSSNIGGATYGSGSGSGSGYSYGSTSGQGVTYGASGSSGVSYGTGATGTTGTTGGISYGTSGTGSGSSGSVYGSSYGTSGTTRYGATGATGTTATSGATVSGSSGVSSSTSGYTPYTSYYNKK